MTKDATEAVPLSEAYGAMLTEYLRRRSEDALYRASLMSQRLVEGGLGPDDIIAIHFEALDPALQAMTPRVQARAIGDAHHFLLEVMIAYGVRYKEYLELRMRQSLREAEERALLERQRAQDAEQAGREMSDILAMIAHEMRTPLTAARGNIDIAVRSLARGQIERLSPLLSSAREALERLSRLTGDLYESSRGGVLHLDLTPLELGQVVRQACAWVRPTATAKGVELTVMGGPTEARITGNADAMLSVFGNLLSNAVRYTPAGGRVEVRQGLDEGVVWIEVADNGIGMPEEVQARIFERFYRAPQARTLERQGLGLGLALVSQFVAAHQGNISVQSAPGAGSLFRITLPLLEAAAQEDEGDESRNPGVDSFKS